MVEKLPNDQIRVYANKKEDVYDFDYLVWAGSPKDFIRCQYNIIQDPYEKQIFEEMDVHFIASSIINMRNVIRESKTTTYLQNEIANDNSVYADFSAIPYVLVSY